MIRLNLGCNNDYREGWINIDHDNSVKVDYAIDFEQDVFPFEDNSVDYTEIGYTLEHLSNIFWLMEEVYRICKPNGIIFVKFEHAMHYWNISDPLHKTRLTEETFRYWTNWIISDYKGKKFKSNFRIVKEEIIYMPPYDLLTEDEKKIALKKYLNVAKCVYQTLEPIK